MLLTIMICLSQGLLSLPYLSSMNLLIKKFYIAKSHCCFSCFIYKSSTHPCFFPKNNFSVKCSDIEKIIYPLERYWIALFLKNLVFLIKPSVIFFSLNNISAFYHTAFYAVNARKQNTANTCELPHNGRSASQTSLNPPTLPPFKKICNITQDFKINTQLVGL